MNTRLKYCATGLLVAFALNSYLPAAEIFQQTFQTEHDDDTWRNISQVGQAKIQVLEDGKPVLRINNHVLGHSLDTTLTKQFSVTVEALHSEDATILWFGLFDKLLENGYVLIWQNPPKDQGYPNGRLSIRKVQLVYGEVPGILLMNKERQKQSLILGKEFAIPQHLATQAPPAKLSLSWDKESGDLIASCDGVEVMRATDTELDSFSAVLISGNKFSCFRSVNVEGE